MAAPLPSSSRPDPAAAVTRIALQVGATPVAQVDIGTMLSGICSALPPAVGVAAAVLVLTEPADPRDPEGQQVFASDDAANRIGLIQHRAGRGPVPAAVRGDRPLSVPDLTVSGPPELAAAAADCGLVRSLVVPLPASGQQPTGGLQLLAGSDTTLDERSASVLWPLVGALSARLADARELARVSALVVAEVEEDEDPEFPPETTAVPTLGEAPPDPTGQPETAETIDEPETEYDAGQAPEPDASPEETLRLVPVVPSTVQLPELTEGDPVTDLFAAGETVEETPPTGQARLGWDGPEHTPPPTAVPTRALPARVPVLGRVPRPAPRPQPRPIPAAVPEQRSELTPVTPDPVEPADPPGPTPVTAGPAHPPEDAANGTDDPTWRVPRHRLRDDA